MLKSDLIAYLKVSMALKINVKGLFLEIVNGNYGLVYDFNTKKKAKLG